MLPDRLILRPIVRFQGTLALPGSKSLSNRILLLSALADGETEVTRVLDSDDTAVMLGVLQALGVEVRGQPAGHGTVWIKGKAGPLTAPPDHAEPVELFLGNAGTAMRPLTAVLTAGHGTFVLKGVPRMHERPLGDLVDGLRQLGATVQCLGREGYPPVRIEAAGLAGGIARISGATSSQFVSALLMAAPLAGAPVSIEIRDTLVSGPYVAMTVALMRRYGVNVTQSTPRRFEVAAPQRYRSPGRVLVEGDASSASYFLAGAAITGGTVRVEGCGSDSLQGDARFAEVLERMGARVRFHPAAIEVEGNPPLRGIDEDLTAMPDAAMTLAVTALFARGPTTLRGIGNWRVKETDRMGAVSAELTKLGARIEVGADTLVVHPPARIRPASIATYNDHRMAMAFSLAACGGEAIVIENPSCVAKTFPAYFDELERLTLRDEDR
ncbi:MAG: 3-phosphoshikimate 1-carboxyvinyltransferase [Candidatus Rokuibacteriota bacterium]